MDSQTLARRITDAHSRGEALALCTVIAVRGSAPRNPGARMLVYPDGRLEGSISGGCLEAEAFARAQEALRTGACSHFEYDLTRDVQEGEGMVCGGKVRVLVEPLPPPGISSPGGTGSTPR